MTLEKAIEILANSAYGGSTTFDQDFKDAEKLGIEALGRVQLYRKGMYTGLGDKLLGETAE